MKSCVYIMAKHYHFILTTQDMGNILKPHIKETRNLMKQEFHP